MTKVSLIAKLTAIEGREAELEAALRDVIAAAAEESALEIYSVHRSKDEPSVYYFFELYTDAAALEVHGKGDRMRAAMAAVRGLLIERPEVTLMTPVTAKGLDL